MCGIVQRGHPCLRADNQTMRWDVFCRVIDNHGDLGVCWRLSTALAAQGAQVSLWADDARALAWMAPSGVPGVVVRPWDEATRVTDPTQVGDVVIEAFGCDPPAAFVQTMAARRPAPVWINLEYLSAESFVERSHGLPSPQPCGLMKWFFYPGFTSRTGGLLREQGLGEAMALFDGDAWLGAHGWARAPGERVISLFGYGQPDLADWLGLFARQPTLLLAAPGVLQQQLRTLQLPTGLRSVELPWLMQTEYDRLLWSCDLNLVRGEDSFVRAQWAGKAMLWQIYPQHDSAHRAKLEAWLDRLLQACPDALARDLRQTQRAWNGFGPLPTALPDPADWQALQSSWRGHLLAQPALQQQLLAFTAQKRATPRLDG